MKKPDPRIMLLIVACLSTMGVLIERTWILVCVFAVTVLLNMFMGARIWPVVKKLRVLISAVFFITLMESIFHIEDAPLLQISGVQILTIGGIIHGVNTLLRMGTVIASAAIFTLTTSRRMIQGLIQLKIPYEFAFMASVALRFLPVFSMEFKDAITAIQLRGVDINKIRLKDKLKMYSYILMPVTYGAVSKAQKLAFSMELRAFRAYPKRTSRFSLKFCGMDYVYMIVMPLITTTVLVCTKIFMK